MLITLQEDCNRIFAQNYLQMMCSPINSLLNPEFRDIFEAAQLEIQAYLNTTVQFILNVL